MAKIKYGVYPNPLKDDEGRVTYQVRHVPEGQMNEREFLAHLDYHNTYNSTTMKASLSVLKDEIVEQLKNNHRFRIDGLGTFQMKVGLKQKLDEEGNPVKTAYTDPNQITANDVEVIGVSFRPDRSFIDELKEKTSTTNPFGRGVANKSKHYERQEVVDFMDTYLAERGSITLRELRIGLGINYYSAQSWLEKLVNEEPARYYRRKMGATWVYYLKD